MKNGIFFLKKKRNLPDRGHSLSHRVKSYYIIITIIVGYCRPGVEIKPNFPLARGMSSPEKLLVGMPEDAMQRKTIDRMASFGTFKTYCNSVDLRNNPILDTSL